MNELFFGINHTRSENPAEMTDLERKHVPVIALEKVEDEVFGITAEVGKWLAHPMEQTHFIEWLEIYVNNTLAFRAEFLPEITKPKITALFVLKEGYEVFAKARCNIHGTWMSKVHRI